MPCIYIPSREEEEQDRLRKRNKLIKHLKELGFKHTSDDLDYLTRILCDYLKINKQLKLSKELQSWWIDHQLQDQMRITREKNEIIKKRALSKLTQEEIKALGL